MNETLKCPGCDGKFGSPAVHACARCRDDFCIGCVYIETSCGSICIKCNLKVRKLRGHVVEMMEFFIEHWDNTGHGSLDEHREAMSWFQKGKLDVHYP